ncbi:hypothetical protein CNR22_08910 [Sphingobacteriaceae bacterium]|nr:hypothetical protein CNR22_08910 [Sphingobacteriaceae bacterium]
MRIHKLHSYFSDSLKKALLSSVLCFYGVLSFSQKEVLAKADKLFEEKRYGEAIPIYDKLYEKKKDRTVLLKLADANFLNENYIPAQRYYAEYFRDSIYENIPQFTNYAKSSKESGKIKLALKLYQKLSDITQDAAAKDILETYTLYADSSAYVRSFDLDSNYKCVTIDAAASLDTLAAPMFYNWEFDDGTSAEGLNIEHCFEQEGLHKVVLNITDKTTGLIRQRDTMLVIDLEKLPVKFKAPKTAKRYFYVDFDASETQLPGYDILDYLWDMDNNGDISSGKKVKYKYNNGRDYQVRLVVIAKNKITGKRELFSANKKIAIVENYEMPSKTFSDSLNGAK